MSGVRPGDVIAGKFQIERVLGEGGMGYVVAARHLQLGQVVALKFMRDEVCTPEYKSRFMREARNTVRLKSKHVSRVLDVGALDGGAPYMVMEYLEGRDLSDRLHKEGPIPVPDACDYIIQACEAIAEAHAQGIVHRDLKPANLFLTKGQSGETVVKVLDFGVSKVLDLDASDATSPGGRSFQPAESVVTKATDLLGSPSYMAPEQIESARNADAQSDIWSLGVILYRIISGKAPFAAQALGELIQQIMLGPVPNLRDVRPDIPAGLEHVIGRCLERDRTRRFRDVAELAQALAPYASAVVTPSLERIAILGPALVTAAPTSHRQPQPSVPSFSQSGAGVWTGPAVATALTPGPISQPTPSPPRDGSLLGAALVGLLFAALLLGAGALAWKKHKAATATPPVPSALPVEQSSGMPTEPPLLDLSQPAGSPTPSGSETPASTSPSASARRPVGGARTKPSASAPEPSPDEIPTTRE